MYVDFKLVFIIFALFFQQHLVHVIYEKIIIDNAQLGTASMHAGVMQIISLKESVRCGVVWCGALFYLFVLQQNCVTYFIHFATAAFQL